MSRHRYENRTAPGLRLRSPGARSPREGARHAHPSEGAPIVAPRAGHAVLACRCGAMLDLAELHRVGRSGPIRCRRCVEAVPNP